MRIKLLYIFIMSCSVVSCIDIIDVNLSEGKEKLVVFGNLTTANSPQFIWVYRTTSFKSIEAYPPVLGAEVYLTDRLGNQIDFEEDIVEHNGYYYLPDNYEIIPGDAFVLTVITRDGEYIQSTREAVSPLSPVVQSNIVPIVDPELEQVDPELDNYYASGLIDDEVGVKNFYRWRVYVNGELRNLPSELTLFDDRIRDGSLFRFDANQVLFKKDDVIEVEHSSLSEGAYKYYQLLKQQTEHDQLDNSYAKPTILEGNLSDLNNPDNIVLGYFSVQDVELIDEFVW